MLYLRLIVLFDETLQRMRIKGACYCFRGFLLSKAANIFSLHNLNIGKG